MFCFIDDLQYKMDYIVELKENIIEMKMKLAQVQQFYEVARSERNAFQRELQATTEDRDDLKERLKVLVFFVFKSIKLKR